jgi:hypothetical protein
MRKLLAVLLLLICAPAFADTFALVAGQYKNGNPPPTCAISSSVGSGQVIIAMQEGGGTSTTVSDGTNTYNVLYSVTSVAQRIFWAVTSASGTYTLTLSGSSGTTYFHCFAFTGFTGTPTSDTAIQNRATGTGVTLAINATSNFANEVLLINEFNANTEAVTGTTGWTNAGSGASTLGFYAFEASSGTANNFSGSITTSSAWYLQLAGIYDNGGSACTHSGKATNTGTFAVPNGSTGSYKLASGAIGAPNCSSIAYPNSVGGSAVN